MVFGNSEYFGRIRGTSGFFSWKVGFSDTGGYKIQGEEEESGV